MKLKLALIGFGTVGRGFVKLLKEKESELKKNYNAEFTLVAISDPVKGSVYQEEGIGIEKVLKLAESEGNIKSYDGGLKGWDSLKTIRESNADVVIEVTPTDIKTGEPGITHIKLAFETGKHVVTTNKGPVALFYSELMKKAKDKNLIFKFEGTVLSGTPVFSFYFNALKGSNVTEIRGILNGTTNFILTEMYKGGSYDEALKKAQELGYAEAKPDADVKGWDAMAKIVILANVIMGGSLKPEDVEVEGITEITPEMIKDALAKGKKYKLIARAWKENSTVKAKVSPETVDKDDLLYHIDGVKNAISFSTDTLGEIVITGPGAGMRETGYAVLADLISIHEALLKIK